MRAEDRVNRSLDPALTRSITGCFWLPGNPGAGYLSPAGLPVTLAQCGTAPDAMAGR